MVEIKEKERKLEVFMDIVAVTSGYFFFDISESMVTCDVYLHLEICGSFFLNTGNLECSCQSQLG